MGVGVSVGGGVGKPASPLKSLMATNLPVGQSSGRQARAALAEWVDGLLRTQPQGIGRQGHRPAASATRAIPHRTVSGPACRRYTGIRPRRVVARDRGPGRQSLHADARSAQAAAGGHADVRYPLRHEVVQVRHHMDRCAGTRPVRAGRGAAQGQVCDGACRVRLHHQHFVGRHHHRRRDRCLRVRGRRDRTGARWTGADRRAAPLLLEEREVGPSSRIA